MPRGFRVARYTTDSGQEFALMVDADSIGDPARGWDEIGPGVLPFAPRGFLPRRMVGRDETGRRRTTRVGTLTCDLWNFVVTEWVLEGSDSAPHTVSATSRNAERQLGPRLPPP
jgi:hypothetical protein